MNCTSAGVCLNICCNWTFFDKELKQLKHIFCKNECPEKFIDISFKKFLEKISVLKQNVSFVEKKTLLMLLSF